jgi:hypothetical protein
MGARRTHAALAGIACTVLVAGCTPQAYQAGYGAGQPAWTSGSQLYAPPVPPALAARVPAIRQYYPPAGYPYPQAAYPQSAVPQAQLDPYQSPTGAYRSPAASRPPSSSSSASQGGQPSQAELQMRAALLQRSMGFGGIFGPTIKGFTQGGGGSSKSDQCASRYSEYAAQQAYRSGHGWAADRLQNHQSSGSEYDWYNR